MSIASEITRLQTSKADIKTQVNIDVDDINEGTDFINDETLDDYADLIENMQDAYKQYIPIHTKMIAKGNITQEGTPTPSSPIEVNNVTGEQVVTISNGTDSKDYEINLGKNLLDEKTLRQGSDYDSTITKRVFFPSNYYLEPGTYTLYTNLDTTNYKYAVGIATNAYPNPVSYVHDTGWQTLDHVTFTLSQSGYLGVGVAKSDGTSSITPSDISNYHFMLCKGSYDSTTSYSPYFEPIELNKIGTYQDFIRKGTGKNLFNQESFVAGDITGTTSSLKIRITSMQNLYLEKGSYTFSWNGISPFRFVIQGQIIHEPPVSPYPTLIYDSRWQNASVKTFTFTLNQSMWVDICLSKENNAELTLDEISNFDYQIEKGPATYYEPYGYKDKWYIEKNVGKVVLNGSESCSRQVLSGNIVRFMFTGRVDGIGGARQTIFSNYFAANLNSANDREGIGFVYENLLYLYKQEASVADFQTWLNTHNTSVYYVLNAPEYTLIENEELIKQLEAVQLQTGKNNVLVSGDLPMILDLSKYIQIVENHL